MMDIMLAAIRTLQQYLQVKLMFVLQILSLEHHIYVLQYQTKNHQLLVYFHHIVFFCGNIKKRQKGIHELAGACETLEASQSIQEAALILNDTKLLSKVSGIDLVAKEAKYHHSCKSAYLMSAKRVQNKSDAVSTKTPLQSPTDTIHVYVEQFIIINKRPELLTSVYARYLDICSLASKTPIQSAQSLMRNLMTKFGQKIKCQTPLGKKLGIIIYNSETADDAVRVAFDYASDDEQIITKAALLLRKQVLTVQRKDLPDNPTLNDLKDGDASTPALLTTFFTTLYSGLDPRAYTDKVMRHVKSSCDDVLFITRRGQVKPAKQIAVGVAMKSITGSKKVIQVLNRFGHSLNYNCLEELETETAEQLQERHMACPDGTVKNKPMGVAFDNFDELTQTLSGTDTLHDTMGILYQNIPDETEQPVSTEATVIEKTIKQLPVKKRSLQHKDMTLEPYRKKPRMSVFKYTNTDVFMLPDVSVTAKKLDFMWMINHALDVDQVPMWVGYNARSYEDKLPKQEVLYMTNMKQPITSLDVVHETLITTQRCAKECGQKFGIVTYDLNAAKPAMQIQATEKPKFDDVFIMPGAFHIEMAFFKAVGKIISDSGGPDVLTDANVLAPGSLNGFLSGKHFNRCKRLHPILALAFEILHFLTFMKTYEGKDQLEELINSVHHSESAAESVKDSEIFVDALTAYTKYTDGTRSGKHGATAQFWMMYIDYIHQYHNLERAIRTNDINLYIYTLTPVIGLFFATNHINYARWLTKFQLDLMNIDESHPGLRDILEEGAFTVRRTEHSFSRVPVDLTLEQTVNADAASRVTGIISSTNNYCARLRWMVTKATRASFVSLVQEMTGLIVSNDVAAELRPTRIQRDAKDLKKVIQQIENSHNPFSKEDERDTSLNSLYNLSTGKAVHNEIKESLLGIPENGQSLHQKFLQSCICDPNRFEEKITKSQLKTFTDDCVKSKRTADKSIPELKATRDLMGRLVLLATKRNLNLQFIFQYPLTPVPFSMCSPDGTMAKTDKSVLFKLLEAKVRDQKDNPEFINACIVDGQFLLHTLPSSLPTTYGGLARIILIQTMALSKVQVHLIFDDYQQPSLKDMERDRRGESNTKFLITGPEQKRPKFISDALKSRSFKTQLPQFLGKEWQDPAYAQIFGSRQLYLDIPGECYHFQVINGVVKRSVVNSLRNNHEEADTKICFHAKAVDNNAVANEKGDIVIRASDTDVAVIMLYHCSKFKSPLWMDVGTAAMNNRRYVNISAIYQSLGHQICAALPGFHAFTGRDYTGSFVRKGKLRPFTKFVKNIEVQRAFQDLAAETELSQSTQTTLQKFTTSIYGAKDSSKATLDAFRYKTFEKAYGPKSSAKNPLEKLKGINASAIPPCESEINMHLKRASFVAHMWVNANCAEINQHPNMSNGWEFDQGHYQPIWHEGPQLPDTLIPEEREIDDDTSAEDEQMTLSSDDETVCSEDEDSEM